MTQKEIGLINYYAQKLKSLRGKTDNYKSNILLFLCPLEKQLLRSLFYNQAITPEQKIILNNLMPRLNCEGELELGIWALQNAHLWANKQDLKELNLNKYYYKELLNKIMVKDSDD